MHKMKAVAAAAVIAMVTAPAAAHGQAVVSGFDAITMQTQDDRAEGPASLGFDSNYFGSTFAQTYVSTNGYVTFNAPQTGFNPVGLGSSYTGQPIIAAFYADVDTNRGGSIGYGNATFGGRDAFGVTWKNVGVYGGSTDDKRNTFQLLLVDRGDTGAGNFDIVLNYDKVQWETGSYSGSNGTNGLGGNSASVGYNAGKPDNPSGTFFSFAGSQTPGSFIDGGSAALTAGSNVGVNGRYLFNVRNGVVAPPPAEGAVPEPATWAMMIIGFGAIGGTMRRRRERMRVRFA